MQANCNAGVDPGSHSISSSILFLKHRASFMNIKKLNIGRNVCSARILEVAQYPIAKQHGSTDNTQLRLMIRDTLKAQAMAWFLC